MITIKDCQQLQTCCVLSKTLSRDPSSAFRWAQGKSLSWAQSQTTKQGFSRPPIRDPCQIPSLFWFIRKVQAVGSSQSHVAALLLKAKLKFLNFRNRTVCTYWNLLLLLQQSQRGELELIMHACVRLHHVPTAGQEECICPVRALNFHIQLIFF